MVDQEGVNPQTLLLCAMQRQLGVLVDGDELCGEQYGQLWQRVHVHLPEQGLAGAGAEPGYTPLLQSQDGEVLQVVTDHLGTPKELVSVGGELLWSAAHTAFGEVIEAWRPPAEVLEQPWGHASDWVPKKPKRPPGSPMESPFRLKGQYYDLETELCCTRHRYFDPNTGYWLTGDPIGTAGGYRLYGFDGAPTVVSDPLGLSVGKRSSSKLPSVESPGGKQGATRPLAKRVVPGVHGRPARRALAADGTPKRTTGPAKRPILEDVASGRLYYVIPRGALSR